MKRFKNILIAVDFCNEGRLVFDGLSKATAEAVESAVWLAKHNSAKLTFLNVLETTAYAETLLVQGNETELNDEAEEALTKLVHAAKKEGVEATHRQVFGKSWVEIIREVHRAGHDLVIAGTRQHGALSSVLFGSTGMKLLRKCPCPVWITKPRAHNNVSSVLVADDLTPVADLAVKLGASMAKLRDADLHVLHALELGIGRPEWDSFENRTRARQGAIQKIELQLAELAEENLPTPLRTHVEVCPPEQAILNCVKKHDIELLVMGTVARGGLTGVITGNTAERLLPLIPCSVLAVKPDDFVSPIQTE